MILKAMSNKLKCNEVVTGLFQNGCFPLYC